MPKLRVGKTILKRPTLTKGQKDSAEEHNKTTLPEPGEGAARPSLQITIPKKLQRANLTMEEDEANNMFEDDNDDWRLRKASLITCQP
ncbi:unnamed protein product [Prunus armeniaca]|uniref:Uncharacterized protein n=1 Tax=Prunus armeniaca TaxID=36596 RepID=A0A6J5W5Z7_PRUAR|nr:unnamed protein product [Prunus armeniaca]